MNRVLLMLLFAGVANLAHAWVYPEHRDIALLAVKGLDASHRAQFDGAWQATRTDDEQRLCESGADEAQGLTPACIDWAALTAIAGDHSCSSAQMFETVRHSDWILTVADVAAQLKVDLAKIHVSAPAPAPGTKPKLVAEAQRVFENELSRAQRLNALRTADTRLQRADAEYATRAGSNLAHFLLSRPDTNLDPKAYASLALAPGSDLNAIGVYAWYHIRALQKASVLSTEGLSAEQRAAWTRAALTDEAFALHFLEDVFAAGHVAGSWGDVSQRKGTHDFYNENGLEVFTWSRHDHTVVLMGDAHMRPQDAEFAAQNVRQSLEQVLDTLGGRGNLPANRPAGLATGGDTFDVCKNLKFPAEGFGVDPASRTAYVTELSVTLLDTPVPGLGSGLGSLPRARSEVGLFVGLAGTLDGRWTDGGLVPTQTSGGGIGGIDMGFRAGLGIEGALGDSSDGLVFGQFGFRADTASTNKSEGTALENLNGSLSAAIPARTGVSMRFRMPFYVVPGDLLLLSPMYFANEAAYTKLAVTAANGGLIPWQQGMATRIGRFQFVLGREIGASWYGLFDKHDQLAAPPATPGNTSRVVSYRSVFVDLPILEYRAYRAFSSQQSSTVLFQLFAGADIPYDETTDSPTGAPPVHLQTIYSLGVRMMFDWRYYP